MAVKRGAGVIVVVQLQMMSVTSEGDRMEVWVNYDGAMMISSPEKKSTVKEALEELEALGWSATAKETSRAIARKMSWARESRVVIFSGRKKADGTRVFDSETSAKEAAEKDIKNVIEALRRRWGAEDHVRISGREDLDELGEPASRLWALWEGRMFEGISEQAAAPRRHGPKAL